MATRATTAPATPVPRTGSSATALPVGRGCIATGTPPQLDGTLPSLGGSVRINVRGAPALASGVSLIGRPHAGIALGAGCTAYVDLLIPTILLPLLTDAQGAWSSGSIPVGSSVSQLGLRVAWQSALVHAPTAPMGLALSNGLELMIGY